MLIQINQQNQNQYSHLEWTILSGGREGASYFEEASFPIEINNLNNFGKNNSQQFWQGL